MQRVLTFIRFSHSVFALPFALGAMFVAANGHPALRIFALIILAMVFARTAAMVFNRIVDWEIDKRNPRTVGRHRLVNKSTAWLLLVASALLFITTTFWINAICFWLSPLALALLFFYSLTKRFTSLCHFFVGLGLGISPVGAWLAVSGRFALAPFVLAAAVLFWVAGFDLIYATQDVEVDRREGLNSLVVRLGVPRCLQLAQWLHVAMFLLLIAFGVVAKLSVIYFASLAFVFAALIYEHRVARRLDLAAINAAFFNSNAFVGFVFLVAVIVDRVWFR